MVDFETEKKTEDEETEEAHAYTPGLKVKKSTMVEKLRRLPLLGEVFVKEGDKIEHTDIVARTEISGDPEIVKISMILGMEPEDTPRYMTVKVGDMVEKGQQLAFYKALFGLIKKEVKAPVTGTLESFSEVTGQAIIRGAPIPVEVDAYIPGKVIEVMPKEGAVIETNAAFIQGIFGIGGEVHGEIHTVIPQNNQVLEADMIKPEYKGKILVGGCLVTLEALKAAVEAGVSAIVSGGIRHDDLTTFTGEEVGVAITGQEEVGITVIITEGFGTMNMSQRTFDLLKEFEGYSASVNGTTQIRAGVLRPEIIIPHDMVEDEEGEALSQGMVSGTPIRIIRQPYFGAIGKVHSLPVELQRLESESMVRVVNIELDEGEVVTVPRANVEIIEE
jgi:biotin carboxyl carrier protein